MNYIILKVFISNLGSMRRTDKDTLNNTTKNQNQYRQRLETNKN